jgi:dynamin GTPase
MRYELNNTICCVSQECNLEEIEEEELSKSLKDSKKANGAEKGPSLVFKITNRVAYKTVLKC